MINMDKVKVTFYITKDTVEQLRKVSFYSRKNKSDLVSEALTLLFKNIPEGEK